MTEAMRLEIVQRRQTGMSQQAIADELGLSRGAVRRALARVQAQRDGRAASKPKSRPRRPSIIDPFEPILRELLAKYPNITAERAVQELQSRGFTGKYTVVHRRLRLLRPRAAPARVPRFETCEGQQAQMDYGVYDIDFTREGRRRVYLFSYLLGYSRRQYVRFVESMDLPTTLQEHVHAFHHLGGVARVCLYDNFKAVVLCHDADGAFYNPKFLAFATHYGFRPQACRVRRPQTKGKVERHFAYVESSLLNGRTFETLEHLNEVTVLWLQNIADKRVLRDFQESPRQRHQREQPHLLPLPSCDYDTAQVVYRHVGVDGYLTHRSNHYSVPFSHIGQVLPVRITESEVIIYSVRLEEITRHPLVPRTQTGVRQLIKTHHPVDDPIDRTRLLRERFGELGPVAQQFLDGLLAKQIQGKLQAQQLLALIAHYQRDDVRAAFERAVRFGAFSLAAIRRILAAITELFLAAVTPAQVEVALRALDAYEAEQAEARRQQQLQVQQADYEVELARRRYEAADPANRLVTAELETRWEQALRERDRLARDAEERDRKAATPLGAADRRKVQELAADLGTVWHATTTGPADRKELLRFLVHRVYLDGVTEAGQIRIEVEWHTGARSRVTVPRPPIGGSVKTPTAAVERIRELIPTHEYAVIVAKLNAEGFRTATGKEFNYDSVSYIARTRGWGRSTAKQSKGDM